MQRRFLIAALCALPFASCPDAGATVPQDDADIARAQTYLNAIRTLKARFLQIAPSGAATQGTCWLARPGRLRMQYDKPSPLLLVAGHGTVVFHDAELDQTSNIPLANTPLGILLADNVQLTGAVTVTQVERLPGQLRLTMTRTDKPGEGQLTLVLSDNPQQLTSWIVTDAQQQQTHVSLYDITLGESFDPSLFQYAAQDPFANPPPAP